MTGHISGETVLSVDGKALSVVIDEDIVIEADALALLAER